MNLKRLIANGALGGGAQSIVSSSSLLNELMFALKWNGTSFINAVTGTAMVNHGSVTNGGPIATNGDSGAEVVASSSKYLSTPSTASLAVVKAKVAM